jgi:hypothetical protein
MPSLAWIALGANTAGVVYGLVTAETLLAVESDHGEPYPQAVASLALALAIYWLAHAYADALGERLRVHGRLTRAVLWRALVVDWAIIRGASLPLLVVLICWALGVDQRTGLDVALWCGIASIVGLELLAARTSGAKGRELILEGLVGATIGAAIIALKAILA